MSDQSADRPVPPRREEWTPRFEYTLELVDNYVPDLPGVYKLIYQTGRPADLPAKASACPVGADRSAQAGHDYYVFHVGETNDLFRALMKHLNLLKRELSPPPNPCKAPAHCMKRTLQDYKCYFRFIIERSKSKRSRLATAERYSFIPKGELEFAAWADNFIRVLSANAHKWGIPPEARTKLAGSHKEYMASYDKQLRSKIDLRAAEKELKDTEQKLKDAGQWDWDRNRPKDPLGRRPEQEGEEWKGGDVKP
jgi:hypothetical protein